jgi:hypothetical protein
VIPVRYELNVYILFRRNRSLKSSDSTLTTNQNRKKHISENILCDQYHADLQTERSDKTVNTS